MTTLIRQVTTTTSPQVVFDYLSDFTTAAEWDHGTVSCVRILGDGGPGTVYRNVSRFAGREVTLDYKVLECLFPRFVIEGANATTTSTDTIVVGHDGPLTRVDYTAEFTFHGLARFAGPVMRPLLDRLGDLTAQQLRGRLDQLGESPR